MLVENNFLNKITGGIRHNPDQLNRILEADAELIQLTKDCLLAITTDTIVEEISEGLYRDPYQIGWMGAIVNFSDLAAVGAEPKGFLVNLQVKRNTPISFIQSIMAGANAACQLYGSYIVGGDTNHGEHIQLGGTAFGVIPDAKIIMRKGCQPGDQLFISGKLGLGSVYAIEKLLKKKSNFLFFPKARITEGIIVRKLGSCCIDTSDGFFSAISNLMHTNKTGIRLSIDLNELIHPDYYSTMLNSTLPPWFLLAGPHGEFELVFTVAKKHEKELIETASVFGWNPIHVGEIIPDQKLHFRLHGMDISFNPEHVANLYETNAGNLEKYINALFKIHDQWKRLSTNRSKKIAG